ncbi:MAG: winged helix-turn-helix domain-containing protein [Candidatus Paceibacterota bacterium]
MKKKKTCHNCLQLIGDSTRSKIIKQLKKCPNNVKDIEKCLTLTQPTISYHLNILKKLGILTSKKKGREICYCINEKYPCKSCNILKIPFKT